MSNKTKDELMNANGRTLLANWVEERATLHIDSDVDRKDILKRGHKNIITGEPYQGEKTTTHATYYTQPQPKPKEAGATSLSKLRYEQALFEVLEETEREEANQFKQPVKRTNPTLPRPPSPPTHGVQWLQEKPISVWSELHSKKRIDGCSAGKTFSKSAQFSTPIVHQMDDQNNDIPYQTK